MILLISPPICTPYLPSLAIEQLASIARVNGMICDTLYPMLMMPRIFTDRLINARWGAAVFTPGFFGLDPETIAIQIAQAEYCHALEVHKDKDFDDRIEDLAADLMLGIEAADECIQQTIDAIPTGRYDIVGFSIGFDAQKLPAAYLARKLKAREPTLKVIIGGTGCDGAMGPAMMEVFPEFDAVIQGEAEATFLPAVEALRYGICKTDIPGALFRMAPTTTSVFSPDLPTTSLDAIPAPDYTSYFAQFDRSEYVEFGRHVLFETSRGCWWGFKHHCKFCGIRAVDHRYRVRDADMMLAQIEDLVQRFDPRVVYSTDAILDMRYFESLLPSLARRRRTEHWTHQVFYETKSNLKRAQIALLAAAGVTWIQPGIESFSTNVLKLVDKGATAMQQVEFLKWAKTYGIQTSYGVLVGTPGETIADYDDMVTLFESLHHFPPPVGVNGLALHRFSPYFDTPDAFGIENIRPYVVHQIMYQTTDDVLNRLCYSLAFDVKGTDRARDAAARDRLARAIWCWQQQFLSGEELIVASTRDSLVLSRRRGNGTTETAVLRDFPAVVYHALTTATTVARVAEELHCDYLAVDELVSSFCSRGWAVRVEGKVLATAIPLDADPWIDAGLGEFVESVSEPTCVAAICASV